MMSVLREHWRTQPGLVILEFVQQRDAQGEKSCLESLSFKAENDNTCHCQSCQQELDYMEQMVTTEKQATVTALMHFSVRLLNRNDNSVLVLWYGIPWTYWRQSPEGHSGTQPTPGSDGDGEARAWPSTHWEEPQHEKLPFGGSQGSHHPPKQCCWDLKAVLSTGTTATSGKKQSTRKRHLSRLLVGQVLSKGKGYRISPPVPSLRLKDIGTATIKPVIFNWAWNDTTERKKIISLAWK